MYLPGHDLRHAYSGDRPDIESDRQQLDEHERLAEAADRYARTLEHALDPSDNGPVWDLREIEGDEVEFEAIKDGDPGPALDLWALSIDVEAHLTYGRRFEPREHVTAFEIVWGTGGPHYATRVEPSVLYSYAYGWWGSNRAELRSDSSGALFEYLLDGIPDTSPDGP